MAKKYDASSIESYVEDRVRVQEKPNLYIPDKKFAGALHCIREIVDK